ncbi:hypothetical protein EMIHUDRAFT_205702 [Emiliania huxleyi CCMP1516]|uniref:Uncharacterized protein n=2 Tax=Emiliania huxleyi TaxID=2903 RepID=A0A0D3JSV8_EMIH1|nr:hypothetical protein EMIHUDRAFT_205702 [Emiliania huxleyi CCMP1516]EOD26593.1 hypothetical protein EMIHUDRAFT_205702 [Emiliania huxleyi CCMP1516]|eukprot:XP_005779022.1 hypothetical protein EMIHUDRAFT_205702 [Emiliania huxleyi CCMP1516]
MHEAYGTKEALGAGHDPRHGSRDHGTQWYYGARWHSVPPPSDEVYGAPGEGALEWEQLRLQSRSLLTPAALGGGVRTGSAPGGRALHTCKPPALHEGDRYVGLDGASHKPERRADRAELAWTQAEVKRLRAQLEALRGREPSNFPGRE